MMTFTKKITIILNITLFILIAIAFKVWHLSMIQKEDRLKDAKRPKIKSVHSHANRGLIYDRYNVPVAVNRISFNASIYYSDIKQIPQIHWKKQKNGKKIKFYPRKDHIKRLSKLLAKELEIDEMYIEDLIHSKASLFPHTPFIIKKNISQEKYFRLKLFERDFIGLNAEISSNRYYPHGKLGADIIGYLGSINKNEYLKISNEIFNLQNFLEKAKNNEFPSFPDNFNNMEEVQNRLEILKKRSYTINDLIGKAGIEKIYEEELRGFHGKKIFEVDILGNFLKKLPNSIKPIPGKSVKLTISYELQKFAERLLTIDEKDRIGLSRRWDVKKEKSIPLKQPWLKGGAILALDPKNGEILAMASHPSFNPNDFTHLTNKKIKNINRWLETKSHIENIFDGRDKFQRDSFSGMKKQPYLEKQNLSFEYFLDCLLPADCEIRNSLEKVINLKIAIDLQEDFEALIFFSKQKNALYLIDLLYPEANALACSYIPIKIREKIKNNLQLYESNIEEKKNNIDVYLQNIKNNKDKLFLLDLLKIFVHAPSFSTELVEKVNNISLADYWNMTKEFVKISSKLSTKISLLFYENEFKPWALENKETFIKEKRREEKILKRKYAKPYIDYLKEKEISLFSSFWKKNKYFFLKYLLTNVKEEEKYNLSQYFEKFEKFENFSKKPKTFQKMIKELPQNLIVEFLKTFRSFKELDRPLFGKYRIYGNLEKDLAASFYPKEGFNYSRSIAYKEACPVGSIFKIATAYSALIKKNKENTNNLNPLTITDIYKWDPKVKKQKGIVVGYTEDGHPLTRFYKGGRLPRSSDREIGRVDLKNAFAQSSNPYFALLASEYIKSTDDFLEDVKKLYFGKKTNICLPGEFSGNLPKDLKDNKSGLYSFAIGHHSLTATPLQASMMFATLANFGKTCRPKLVIDKSTHIQSEIEFPTNVRNYLFEAMDRVINDKKGNARANAIRKLFFDKELKQDYLDYKHQFIGKTSTAEIMYNPYILPSFKADKYKHIWFGCISFTPPKKDSKNLNFDKNLWQNPELVIVVFLRYGTGGKEAAPIALEMIKKYREITNSKQF